MSAFHSQTIFIYFYGHLVVLYRLCLFSILCLNIHHSFDRLQIIIG